MNRTAKWLIGAVIFVFLLCAGGIVWLWENDYIQVVNRLSYGTDRDEDSAKPQPPAHKSTHSTHGK